MTEDDTFKVLKKSPFIEVLADWDKKHYTDDYRRSDAFFDRHGWTFTEFYDHFWYKFKHDHD